MILYSYNMKPVYTKITTVIAIVALFFLYGAAITFATPPTSQYTPSEILNPSCTPGATNCSVTTGWLFDTGNSYMYNTTDSVGIGTATPAAPLNVYDALSAADNDGYKHGMFTELIINPTEDITDSTYSAHRSSLKWDTNESAYDITTGAVTGLKTLYGIYQDMVVFGSGDHKGSTAGFFVNTLGDGSTDFSGTIEDFDGIHAVNINYGTGTADESTLFKGTTLGTGSNTITDLQGIYLDIQDLNATWFEGIQVAFDDLTVSNSAHIFSPVAGSVANVGTGDSVTVFAGFADLTTGVESHGVTTDGVAIGYGLTGGNTGSSWYALNATEEAYGILFDDYALNGGTTQHGIYISDLDAENYLFNGVRIGADSDDNKFDDASNGSSSTTMYIGNETIDTSVSDERLKANIEPVTNSALDFLSDFEVVSFDWHSANKRSQYGTVPFGLIAQDVDEIAPQYTKKTDNPEDYMSVRFQDLVPALIAAVQELQSQLTDRAVDLVDDVREIFVKKVSTEELCVGERCVTEDEFNALFDLLESEDQNDDYEKQEKNTDSENDELEDIKESEEGQDKEEVVEELEESESEESDDETSEEQTEEAVESEAEEEVAEEVNEPKEQIEEEVQEELEPEPAPEPTEEIPVEE